MSIFHLRHCPQNPTLEYAKSIEIPKDCTEIVSRGGGSTIDVGKWLAKENNLFHTVIPTTAGTGSEATKFCVLTVDGVKTTFTDDAYIPNNYILDPTLVTTLPSLYTVSTGLDALCQSFESLWSKNSTLESQDYAKASIQLVFNNLYQCHRHPNDTKARMNMLIAANLSGKAINITKTNVCHALSYPLTSWYNIKHGIACAMSLPYFAKKAGIDMDLEGFIKQFNLLKYKIDKEKVAEEVMKSPKLKDFPVKITKDDLLSCYM